MRCFATAAEQEAFFGALPAFPVHGEIPAWLAAYRDYTNRCARVAGPIIDHSSTANFVRDLDLLRQAVGDPGFSFLGYSYGSQVGSTYAAMFPSRVRAVVIDGVVDPVAWSTGYGVTGALLPITTRLKSAEGASDTLRRVLPHLRGGRTGALLVRRPGRDRRRAVGQVGHAHPGHPDAAGRPAAAGRHRAT